MAENKKRQPIILLHGNGEFTLSKAEELGLNKGELVVEHGSGVENVKLHTLTSDADNNGVLATFVTEAVLNAGVDKLEKALESEEAAREAADNAEAAARLKADEDEAAAREAADTKLGEDIEAEKSAREAADTALTNAITAETAAREAAIAQEVLDRNAAIKVETDARVEADNALNDAITAETAAREAIGSVVTTLVGDDANKSVRKIANEELAAQLLTGKADADFETLQQLASWLEDHPESVAAINEELQAINGKLGADFNTSSTGETVTKVVSDINKTLEDHEGRIETLETTVGDAESGLVKSVADNADAISKNAEDIKALQDALGTDEGDKPVSDRVSDIEGILGDENEGLIKDVADNAKAIESEESARVAADTALNDAITGETADRVAEVARLDAAISAETEERKTAVSDAVSALTAYVDGEIDGVLEDLESAKDALNVAISAETSAREAAVTAEAEAREAADTALTNAITAETAAREAAVAAEEKARQEADEALNQRVGTLESDHIKSIVIDGFKDNNIVSIENNVATIDFSSITIDGGEY